MRSADRRRARRAIPDTKTTTWVDPLYVCEVRFREWTPDGVLRHAAFLRLRRDKDPRNCERQRLPGRDAPQLPAAAVDGEDNPGEPLTTGGDGPLGAVEPVVRPVEKTFNFSNLKKVYWPAERYTKGDLIDYYRAIAPWMLPYLRNRPLVMTRFPDGIDGSNT